MRKYCLFLCQWCVDIGRSAWALSHHDVLVGFLFRLYTVPVIDRSARIIIVQVELPSDLGAYP